MSTFAANGILEGVPEQGVNVPFNSIDVEV